MNTDLLFARAYQHQMDANENHGAAQYLRSRLYVLKEMKDAIANEERAIGILLKLAENQLCAECKGNQRFWVHESQDEGRYENCRTCGGTGLAAKASAST